MSSKDSDATSEQHFTNADDCRIFCRYWNPEQTPKALFLIVHGLGEHCGRYQPIAEMLTQLGFVVFSQDHIGHGKSEGYKGDVSDYNVFLRDLLQHVEIMKEKYPDLPLFLLGHSMGGAIALLLAHRNPNSFKCVILSSPMITKNVAFNSNIKVTLLKMLNPVFPRFPSNSLDTSMISRDLKQVELYRNDPLVYHGRIQLRMAYQCYLLSEHASEVLPEISFPFLTLHGDKDGLCDVSGSKRLHDLAKSDDKTIKIFEGCYHELIHETDDIPQRFLNEIKTWLKDRMT